MDLRRAYLESLVVTGGLVADPTLDAAWERPSVLPGYTVGDLAGHLVRTVVATDEYRRADPPPPDVRRLTASEYYVVARPGADVDSDANRRIMGAAHDTAVDGPAALRAALDGAAAALARALPLEAPDRAVRVVGDLPLLLDEYLVTRMVELAVHLDDLAISIGVDTPELPDVARACVLGCLLALSRDLHGDLAVVRAFTRRERDDVDALRVL